MPPSPLHQALLAPRPCIDTTCQLGLHLPFTAGVQSMCAFNGYVSYRPRVPLQHRRTCVPCHVARPSQSRERQALEPAHNILSNYKTTRGSLTRLFATEYLWHGGCAVHSWGNNAYCRGGEGLCAHFWHSPPPRPFHISLARVGNEDA